VTAFSVFTPCGAGKVGLFGVYGHDLQAGANHEEIEFASGSFAPPSLENDPGFEDCSRRDQAIRGCSDGIEKSLALGFGEKDCGEGGSIDDHGCRCLSCLARKPVLVVAEDFVWRAGIQNRKLIHTPEDFFQLAGNDASSALLLEPVEAFLQGFLNGSSQGFPGSFGDLTGEALCFHALDTKCHSINIILWYLLLYTYICARPATGVDRLAYIFAGMRRDTAWRLAVGILRLRRNAFQCADDLLKMKLLKEELG
jgi:hypothetical protein